MEPALASSLGRIGELSFTLLLDLGLDQGVDLGLNHWLQIAPMATLDPGLDPSLNLSGLGPLLQSENGVLRIALLLFPFALLVELPLTLVMLLGVLRWKVRELSLPPKQSLYRPRVSCLITCYGEGAAVQRCLLSLCEQTYPGEIELIPVLDGAAAHPRTLAALRGFAVTPEIYPKRRLRPLLKWQRGGRVSSLNAGLAMSTGTIILALDGDTSFDNTMVTAVVRHFEDPDVPAVAGCLRVRNSWESLATAIQAIEYLISIQMAKIGLAEWNLVNNISGAFGAFRRSILVQIGGWDTHSAEDLDLTLRIKSYFSRHRRLRIPFEPRAIGHTDGPTSFRGLLKQRLRWDGDLLFLYGYKHAASISPRQMGWPNFIMTVVSGLFVQLVLPFMILGSTAAILLLLPWRAALALGALVYAVYLLWVLLNFIAMLILVSDRPLEDLRFLPVLVVFPLTMFGLRCWSAVAILNELLRRSHEDSAMAPWWVLKRANRF
jgi:cellulose synthase/poly-beta-1,6-N-acetylglucosamine synthase-like glycosyltransferase